MVTSDKVMDYQQIVSLFFKAAAADEHNEFVRFRMYNTGLAAYVLTHAYDLWSTNYDKWDTVDAFAINYMRVIEAGKDGKWDKIAKWCEHGEMVRNLMIGG